MGKRDVIVYIMKCVDTRGTRERTEIGRGKFVQYGCDFEEFENGVGNYTTAVIEMPNGRVKNWCLDLITFVDGDKENI